MSLEAFQNIFSDLTMLKQALTDSILVGEVTSVDLSSSKVKVKVEDGKVVQEAKWISQNLGNKSLWSNLKSGQKVLVLAVGGNLNNAYILGHVVQNSDRPADYDDGTKTIFKFNDDVSVVVDDALAITVGGLSVKLQDDKLKIELGTSVLEITSTKIELKVGLNCKIVINPLTVDITSNGAQTNFSSIGINQLSGHIFVNGQPVVVV